MCWFSLYILRISKSFLKTLFVLFCLHLYINLFSIRLLAAEQTPNKATETTKPQEKTKPEDLTESEVELNSGSAQKTKWEAVVIRDKDVTKQIASLRLLAVKIPVFLVQKDNMFRPLVAVEFEEIPSDGRVLIAGEVPLAKARDPRKKILYAYLNSKQNDVTLVYKVGKKSVKTEKMLIMAPDAQEYSVVSPWDALRIALGSTLLGYQQTGYDTFYSWNGMISLQYHSPERSKKFGYNVDLDATVLTARATEDSYAPQLMTGKIEGVYFYEPPTESVMRYHFLFGLNYLNIFSNGAPFGVKNLITADLGTRLRYIIDEKVDYYGGFRLALFDTKFKDLGFECELSRSLLFKNLHRGEVGFKYLNYSYHPDSDNAVGIRTYTLFISYSL